MVRNQRIPLTTLDFFFFFFFFCFFFGELYTRSCDPRKTDIDISYMMG